MKLLLLLVMMMLLSVRVDEAVAADDGDAPESPSRR
jgi:hypothetical protein